MDKEKYNYELQRNERSPEMFVQDVSGCGN